MLPFYPSLGFNWHENVISYPIFIQNYQINTLLNFEREKKVNPPQFHLIVSGDIVSHLELALLKEG